MLPGRLETKCEPITATKPCRLQLCTVLRVSASRLAGRYSEINVA